VLDGLLSWMGVRPAEVDAPCYGTRSPRWPAVREAHLKVQPACQLCGAIGDNDVHHLRPFHLVPKLELDPSNLMTLCRPHHLLAGHLMLWQSYNPDCVFDVAFWRSKIQRRPKGDEPCS
jgi:5-methylcytosine-specific restriction protein A